MWSSGSLGPQPEFLAGAMAMIQHLGLDLPMWPLPLMAGRSVIKNGEGIRGSWMKAHCEKVEYTLLEAVREDLPTLMGLSDDLDELIEKEFGDADVRS